MAGYEFVLSGKIYKEGCLKSLPMYKEWGVRRRYRQAGEASYAQQAFDGAFGESWTAAMTPGLHKRMKATCGQCVPA